MLNKLTRSRLISILEQTLMPKDIILTVGPVELLTTKYFHSFNKKNSYKYKFVLIKEKTRLTTSQKKALPFFEEILEADFDSKDSLNAEINKISDSLVCVTARFEKNVELFSKLIAVLPKNVLTPSQKSLELSTDKVKMKEAFAKKYSGITPEFTVVEKNTPNLTELIEDKINYPVILKPAKLSRSRLITLCKDRKELESALKNIFSYLINNDLDSTVLAEKFISGKQYTMDGYVDSRGEIKFCPMVSMITGYEMGFEDFSSHMTMTPSDLSGAHIKKAETIAREAIVALGLLNTTVQLDMVFDGKDWFVLEVGARIGSMRNIQYELSYGIHHSDNDLYTRMPEKNVSLPSNQLGYTAVLKLFPREEGVIKEISGIEKTKILPSTKKVRTIIKPGREAIFAKNGGRNAVTVVLFNENKNKILDDISSAEQNIKIVTKQP